MKSVLIAISLFGCAICFADEKKNLPPEVPEVITLTNGAVLRGVSIVRWQGDSVVIKYVGGVAPIRLTNMAPESRGIFELLRTTQKQRAMELASPSDQIIQGEVFIVTNGRENVKLGSTEVRIYREFDEGVFRKMADEIAPMISDHRISGPTIYEANRRAEIISRKWDELLAGLPPAEMTVTTDSEGKFSANLKGIKDYVVVVATSRMLKSTSAPNEYYAWVVRSRDVIDAKRVLLSSNNEISLGF